ncbi:MAG: YkgJ family cysteine cluster protein [Phycisphaeraceae bacterium]|nr:YkgJ family cysteine cluster protein [Phycisphaerales bacterium]MCA9307544.1 YkgJ family cysteine cluster protein [Phycisphaerales bacterium]MCB9843682.1 YkgJ family cysteine cluster protein [Phycisphaeraceae bacterium]
MLLDDGSILAFVDDRCPHLSAEGLCRIYETRPRGCRAFDCSREPGYLRTNPRVAALLSVEGIPVDVLLNQATGPMAASPGAGGTSGASV